MTSKPLLNETVLPFGADLYSTPIFYLFTLMKRTNEAYFFPKILFSKNAILFTDKNGPTFLANTVFFKLTPIFFINTLCFRGKLNLCGFHTHEVISPAPIYSQHSQKSHIQRMCCRSDLNELYIVTT